MLNYHEISKECVKLASNVKHHRVDEFYIDETANFEPIVGAALRSSGVRTMTRGRMGCSQISVVQYTIAETFYNVEVGRMNNEYTVGIGVTPLWTGATTSAGASSDNLDDIMSLLWNSYHDPNVLFGSNSLYCGDIAVSMASLAITSARVISKYL